MDIIVDNPDQLCDWNCLSYNKNITWDIINSNPDKPWDWDALSGCAFNKEKEMYYKRKFIQENLLEEFVKHYMRPERKIKMLETMDIDPEQLDDYL